MLVWFHQLFECSGISLVMISPGFVYRSRRSTDKQQLFDSVFFYLIYAFDTLDGDDSLPDIYCEALDLLSLPALELDPVSKQLEANTKALRSLCTSIETLPPKVVQSLPQKAFPQIQSLQSLKDLVDSVQKLKDQFSRSLEVSIKELNDFTSRHTKLAEKLKDQLSSVIVISMKELKGAACNRDVAPPRPANSNVHSIDRDRRNNIIIFGLEEKPLLETRKDVKRASWSFYVVMLYVPFNDAYRLGKF